MHTEGRNIATSYTRADDRVVIAPPQGAGPGANLHLKIDANGRLFSDVAEMDSSQGICKNK